MRLCAIFHCWDDWKLLRYAVDNIRQVVDGIIIIGSTRSNYGEFSPIPSEWHIDELYIREPKFNLAMHSETDKRNYGLTIAREKRYTHFITMDADEIYLPDEFIKAKAKFSNPDLNGLVCPCVTYFSSPQLTIGRDYTLVPHIHRLTPTIEHAFNKKYPFAWEGNAIRIDPTRAMNINSGVEYTEDITMHHLSWVREDYQKKIRNSTARANLERSTILHDLVIAKDGEMCMFYGKVLSTTDTLNGILDKDLFKGHKSVATANQAGPVS